MKQFSVFFILTVVFSFSCLAQDTKKVLFIGNSYTGVNNLPFMVSEMADSAGDDLIYDSNTPGGARFMDHATNTTTLNKIASEDWDYVVLQAQSQETALSEGQMETEVYPYAESLSDAIRANNLCSQPMFYMTWGRENGDASNCPYLPWVCTYEGMDDAIRDTYMFMTEENEAEVSSVGAVWRYIRTNHPDLDLYAGDGSHPSITGSYAAGCAFYAMVYKKDPTQISWNSSLPEDDANTIRTVAKAVVFDSIADWDYTINPAQADFTETIDEAEVTFSYTGGDFDSLLWDFGDGSSSTETDPVHIYEESGDYTVSQEVTACGETDTQSKTLSIETGLGTKTINTADIRIYPNPVVNELHLRLNKSYTSITLTLTDISGKIVRKQGMSGSTTNLTLDVPTLSSGLYFLTIEADDQVLTKKVFKR